MNRKKSKAHSIGLSPYESTRAPADQFSQESLKHEPTMVAVLGGPEEGGVSWLEVRRDIQSEGEGPVSSM
ncbi:MAG: hypothetical protein ACUVX8_11390 [Candidatus Zipacnadales bacterium]